MAPDACVGTGHFLLIIINNFIRKLLSRQTLRPHTGNTIIMKVYFLIRLEFSDEEEMIKCGMCPFR
jgi:hypothetical protein